MTGPVGYVISLAIFFVAAITRPQRATCPPGWWLDEGVRRDGSFACHHMPTGKTERNARGILVDESTAEPGEIRSSVYCTGGARPIVVDGTSVGCQRGGWE